MKKLRGVGLPNVYLVNGFDEEVDGSTAYLDLDGLYNALAGAVAMRGGALTGPELRFLRKRLGMTQDDVASLGEKSAQAVAKWEKEQAPVPLAESTLLRLVWLERHSRRHLAAAVRELLAASVDAAPCDYVLHFNPSVGWREDIEHARASAEAEARADIHRAMTAITTGRVSTASFAVVNEAVLVGEGATFALPPDRMKEYFS